MKYFLPALVTISAIIGCSSDNNEQITSSDTPQTSTNDIQDGREVDTTQAAPQLDSFQMRIDYPEDIMLYKSRKQGANNGSARPYSFYHKPDTSGFYYHFLLFHPSPPNIDPAEMFKGMGLVVYRYGKKIGHYSDTNEAFISFWSRLPEPELRSFNLVGKSKSYVIELLGDNYTMKKDLMIYSYANKVMVVRMKGDNVDWFRYTILNFELTSIDQLPKELCIF